MKILLDKTKRSAVFVAQADFKPRVYRRNRTELRYFCAHSLKGAAGWGRLYNILREKSVRRTCTRFEATRQPSICLLQKYRRYPMQTVNVSDAVNDCAYVLSFLDAAFTFPQRQQITLSYDAHCGLSLILADLSQRLSASADAISNNQTTLEV